MDEFDKILTELGWRRVDLARRLGLAKESVSRWHTPPKYVMSFLYAMLHIKRLRDEAQRFLERG